MQFFLFEIKYVLRRPIVYIFMAILGLMVGLAVALENFTIGGWMENLDLNAPYVVQTNYMIMIMVGFLFIIPMFVNGALREYNNNFHEITFSKPISKASFFFGKFFAGLVLGSIPFLGILLGFLIGVLMPGADPEKVGSFQLLPHINSFLIFVLPSVFIVGTLVFLLALATKKAIYGYIGALVFVVLTAVLSSYSSELDNQLIGAYLDPLGINAFDYITKYWSPAEKNINFVSPFNPLMLINRVIWTGFFGLILFVYYLKFDLLAVKDKSKKQKEPEDVESSDKAISIPAFKPIFTSNTWLTQYLNSVKINTKYIVFSGFFIIIIAFFIVQLFTGAIRLGGYGISTLPVTGHVVQSIIGPTYMFMVIILVFFTGELYWREKENKIAGIIDATPSSTSVHYFGKFTALMISLSILAIIGIIVGVSHQIYNGFFDIKFNVYFISGFIKPLLGMIFWIAISFFVQSLVSNKFLGYFIVVILFVIKPFLKVVFEFETNLLSINSTGSLRYSDMNGYGFFDSYIWFTIYWLLFAGIFTILTLNLWNKGESLGFFDKFKALKHRFSKKNYLVLSVLVGLIAGVGSIIYYNTKVLNKIVTSKEYTTDLANYEKNFKKYENVVQPILKDANYNIDIYPNERKFVAKSILSFENESDVNIDSLHFTIGSDDWDISFEIPNSKLVLDNPHYRIYKLDKALKPDERLDYTINSTYHTRGFTNNGRSKVHKNGTFISSFTFLPVFGYDKNAEINSKSKRKKYDLPEKKNRVAALKRNCSKDCMSNYIGKYSNWVNIETTISTIESQIAIAPGSLVKKWDKNGRNYYKYKIDVPSLNFVSFVSAEYKVKKDKVGDVDLEIYYHHEHTYNLEKMMNALKSTISYNSKNYGKYYHKQARIIEFPYGSYAQAFPGTMPYSENVGFILDIDKDNGDLDIAFKIGAHETSHQWWAHQVIGGDVQGATMLSESFAEYSSLMILKNEYGEKIIPKYTKYDVDRYMRGRASESKKEEPLYKVEGESYVRYPKGGVSLFAIQELIGEDSMNAAMKQFIDMYAYKEPPYPTTLDFIDVLESKVPDSMKYIIDDYLKQITFYDSRVKEVQLDSTPSNYNVTVDLSISKTWSDSLGNETNKPINDLVFIGLYTKNNEQDSLIDYRSFRLKNKEAKLKYSIKSKPYKLVIDPYHLWMDKIQKDNEKKF